MIEVTVTCVGCGETYKIKVPKAGFDAWYNRGVGIQYAMPNVSPEDRELLMSHLCNKCFEEAFNDD